MGEGRGWQGRRRGNIEEVLKTKVRTIKETETGKKVRRGEEKRKEGRRWREKLVSLPSHAAENQTCMKTMSSHSNSNGGKGE